MENKAVLILDNIRSAHNVGAIFRTADAVGISKIYLAGITPLPVDRFGRERQDIKKAALGAEKNIAWESAPSSLELISLLKKEGFSVIAVEQSSNSVDYKKVKINYPVAFIFGNEVGGLSLEVLAKVDTVAEIPMLGQKESLNVSVSVGAALFRMLNI